MEELEIKVPVFVTRPQPISDDQMFGGDYESMIQNAIDLIDNFKGLRKKKKNKTRESVIDSIECTRYPVLNRPALLLQVKAYDTNLNDGYFETDTRIEIGSEGKIGCDNNFILLFPQIEGVNYNSRSCSFLLLAYEDPTKENGAVAKLAKAIAKDVLKQPVKNVKPEIILESIREMKNVPELYVTYTSLSFDEDSDSKYQQYRSSFKLKKEREEVFKDLPSDMAEEIVNNIKNNLTGFEKGIIRAVQGKKQYKIIAERAIKDAEEQMKELGELVFNMTTSIPANELEKRVNDKDFIVEKLTGVLTNFDSYAS